MLLERRRRLLHRLLHRAVVVGEKLRRHLDVLHVLAIPEVRIDLYDSLGLLLGTCKEHLRSFFAKELWTIRLAYNQVLRLPAVDLPARLSYLLLEVEIHLFEAWLHLLKGKYRLVHDGNPHCRRHALPLRVRDANCQLALRSRQIRISIGNELELEVAGRLHNNDALVAHDVAVGADDIGARRQRSRKARIDSDFHRGLAVNKFLGESEIGLSFADEVNEHRPLLHRRERLRVHGLPDLVQRALGAKQDAVSLKYVPGGKLDFRLRLVAFCVARRKLQSCLLTLRRHEFYVGKSAFVRAYGSLKLRAESPGNITLGGSAVRVRGYQVNPVREPGYERTRLRDGQHQKRALRYRHVPRERLLVVGGISDADFKFRCGFSLEERLANEVIGELHLRAVMAVCVGLSRDCGEGLVCNVELISDDFHLSTGNRLAEEIIHLQLHLGGLPRRVELLVGLEIDLELGKHVPLDSHGLFLARFPHDGPNLIRPHVQLIGQNEIRKRYSEMVRQRLFFENLITLRVLYLDDRGDRCGRLEIGPAERERTNMNGLPRLVDGLVGGKERLGRGLDGDGFFHLVRLAAV